MFYAIILIAAVALTVWNVWSFIDHTNGPNPDPASAYGVVMIQGIIIAGALVLAALVGLADLITWILA